MKRWLALGLVLIFVLANLVLGIVTGIALDRRVLARFLPLPTMPEESYAEFGLMAEAWNAIQKNYVRRSEVEPRAITYGAMQGMVDALGDTGHSRFLSPEMVRAHLNEVRGELEGVGVQVQLREGQVVIVAPIDDSPAQRAGLRPGDLILAVDGQEVAGLALEEVIARVTGPAGTPVTLTILKHETGETEDVTLTRERIALDNVTWQQLPGTEVAQVRIAAFSGGVSRELAAVLAEIEARGLDGVVLDLRSNPGGLLGEAVATASQFLAEGNVLLVRDAQKEVEAIPVEVGAVAPRIPLAVLINEGTASAAEIVAGALQDADRATIVGETTFGTGTVLLQFPLSDGSALLLATEEWLTPAGRVIWKEGIAPDVEVELAAGALPLLPHAGSEITSEDLETSSDDQLRAALDLLSDSADVESDADHGPDAPPPALAWQRRCGVAPACRQLAMTLHISFSLMGY